MCVDPITLLTIAGSAVSAGGALLEGRQAEVLADHQAKALEQQARAEAAAGGYEQRQERRRQELLAANARAQAGASGVALTGSPTEVLAANAREGELALGALRYGALMRQNQLATQAAISRYSGRQARVASYFSAGEKLLSGAAALYRPKPPKFSIYDFPPPPNPPGGSLS